MQAAGVSEIAEAIARYVEQNPEAQDTLEGIAQWWLLDMQSKPRTTLIREALNELIAEGLITAQKGMDAQILYRAMRSASESNATSDES